MSKLDNDNVLLRESMGKGKITILKGGECVEDNADFFCIHCPINTVFSQITLTDQVTASAGALATVNALQVPAGTTIFMRIIGVCVVSGLAICYTEEDLRITE